MRNALNLKDNKTLIGKKVKLFGDLASYFNVPGLKTVTYFELEDGTKGEQNHLTLPTQFLKHLQLD